MSMIEAFSPLLSTRFDAPQEMMEVITKSESLPKRLTNIERRNRLEAERRLPEKTLATIEMQLRTGLWKKHQDDVRGSTKP